MLDAHFLSAVADPVLSQSEDVYVFVCRVGYFIAIRQVEPSQAAVFARENWLQTHALPSNGQKLPNPGAVIERR